MNFWQILCLVIVLVVILGTILIVRFLLKSVEEREKQYSFQTRAHDEKIAKLKRRIEELEGELLKQKNNANGLNAQIEVAERDNNKLKNELHRIKGRYCIAEKVYPGLDRAVNEEIIREKKEKEIDEAKRVERVIKTAITKEVSVDTMEDIFEAMELYQGLIPYQKTYVDADITELSEKYKAAMELHRDLELKRQQEENQKHAKGVEERIKAIIAKSHGSACSLYNLQRARALYDGLSSDVTYYFDKSILDELNNLLYDAQNDMIRRKNSMRKSI